MDGSSFTGVLKGTTDVHRKYVYGMHNNFPEGPPYPTRTISDGVHRLIVNLTPDEMFIEKHLMGLKGNAVLNNPYWGTLGADAWIKPNIYSLIKRYQSRPPLSFYNTSQDPYEMNDLAGDPKYADQINIMKKELLSWMKVEGDPMWNSIPRKLTKPRKKVSTFFSLILNNEKFS